MFKTALERMPSDTHKFVIRTDCTPTCELVRRFNEDPTKSRDFVFQRRSMITRYSAKGTKRRWRHASSKSRLKCDTHQWSQYMVMWAVDRF